MEAWSIRDEQARRRKTHHYKNYTTNNEEETSAVETSKLWPLEKVISMHAGEVVEENGEKVDAFYAQAWCFAKFLYESENGRFRPSLQKWLAETADGTVFDPSHTHNRAGGPWNRSGVKPMIEH